MPNPSGNTPGDDTVSRSLLRFSVRVALGTLLAVAALYLLLHDRERHGQRNGAEVADGPVDVAPGGATVGERGAPGAAAAGAQEIAGEGGPRLARGPRPLGPVAEAVETSHAAGELSEIRRTFPPCPGGDVRRLAWVDEAQRVRKLVRQRGDGAVAEEWFDARGRPGEARLRLGSGSAASWRLVRYEEDGRDSAVDAGAPLPPGAALPALTRGDPGEAFFGDAGCERAR